MSPRTWLVLVPTAFMIFGVALTTYLGFWQLGRHYEKTAALDSFLAGLERPALGADELGGPPDALVFRKFDVEGVWAEPVALTAARSEGQRVGYGLVQPLRLPSGALLLVDRGWVPRDGLAAALGSIDGVGATARVTGQLRRIEGKDNSAPLPSPGDGFERWPPASWPTLWRRLPEPKVEAMALAGEILTVGQKPDMRRLPVAAVRAPPSRDSLSYAFQWWTFGAILIIVWGALTLGLPRVLRDLRAGDRRSTPPETAPDPRDPPA
jgi:cytochrome oxidase assembly protein ShyY1